MLATSFHLACYLLILFVAAGAAYATAAAGRAAAGRGAANPGARRRHAHGAATRRRPQYARDHRHRT